MSKEIIKVHIADDHKILIDGIEAVLNTQDDINVVGYSLDGQHVLDWFDNNEADVLILDIGMPEKDGLAVLRSFKENGSTPTTIVLTSYNDTKLIKEVLKLGASAFITKENAGESIIEAIKTVQAGDLFFSSDVRDKIIKSFAGNKTTKDSSLNEYFGMLTDREHEILALIGEEYTNKEIAAAIHISPRTVESHKINIMNKLGVKNNVGLAVYLVKHNIVA